MNYKRFGFWLCIQLGLIRLDLNKRELFDEAGPDHPFPHLVSSVVVVVSLCVGDDKPSTVREIRNNSAEIPVLTSMALMGKGSNKYN